MFQKRIGINPDELVAAALSGCFRNLPFEQVGLTNRRTNNGYQSIRELRGLSYLTGIAAILTKYWRTKSIGVKKTL